MTFALHYATTFFSFTADFLLSLPHYFFYPYFLSLSRAANITCARRFYSGYYLLLINTHPLAPADDQYWVFREADVLPGYPQPLRQYGQGIPVHKIDTAIWWEPNGYTYFFSGDRCSMLEKKLSKNMPLLSIRLHTSSWLCTDTGDTMRRLGVQTATSLSQTADGAGFLTHPKEPSSVMTAVNSDLKKIKYSPLVGRMERLPFVRITTDTQSCTYSVESRKTA